MTASARAITWLASAIAALGLCACGGNLDASIGGSLSGLGSSASLVLQNNGSDNLTLSANGSFQFAGSVASGDAYRVTILTQPTNQNCSVSNGSGTVNSKGDDVNSVVVTCTGEPLGVVVTGLTAGHSVTLDNNGVSLIVNTNGTLAEFAGTLAFGAPYNVTVTTQPTGQTCTIANPTGTVSANVVPVVAISCV